LSGRFIDMGYPKAVVAAALGLHRSTLYRSREKNSCREPEFDEGLAVSIRTILDQEETFGYRRVWAHLRFKEGFLVNNKESTPD